MSTEYEQSEDAPVEDKVVELNAADEPEVAVEPEIELTPEQQLEVALAAAHAKADENWDQLLRSRAELENVRKRAARDVENARKFALEKIAGELLPVSDSLELGLEAANNESANLDSVRDGMTLIQQMLVKLMDKSGIRPVEPMGEAFNPELHQAMTMQETSEQAPNMVMAVMQKGYTLNDRLLRPAMVVVSKAPAEPAPASEEAAE